MFFFIVKERERESWKGSEESTRSPLLAPMLLLAPTGRSAVVRVEEEARGSFLLSTDISRRGAKRREFEGAVGDVKREKKCKK